MRYLVMGMIILFLLVWFWPTGKSVSTPDMEDALAGLLAALEGVLRWYATLDHAFQERLWQMMSGKFRAILGALKCLNLFLILMGLYALGLLARLGRLVF